MASAIEAVRKKVMQLQGPILGDVFESWFFTWCRRLSDTGQNCLD